MSKYNSRYENQGNNHFVRDAKNKKLLQDMRKEASTDSGYHEVIEYYNNIKQKVLLDWLLDDDKQLDTGTCICYLRFNQCKGICQGGMHHILDHSEMLFEDGKPTKLFAHPYQLSYRDIEKLNELCRIHGFDYIISNKSFYCPSDTVKIDITIDEHAKKNDLTSYHDFIEQYKDDNTPIGDLAYDCMRDWKFPLYETSLQRVYNYLFFAFGMAGSMDDSAEELINESLEMYAQFLKDKYDVAPIMHKRELEEYELE